MAETCAVLVTTAPFVGFHRSVFSRRDPLGTSAAVDTSRSESCTALGYAATSWPQRLSGARPACASCVLLPVFLGIGRPSAAIGGGRPPTRACGFAVFLVALSRPIRVRGSLARGPTPA